MPRACLRHGLASSTASAGLDGQPATLRHGVARVDDEVHHDLFHLAGVDAHERMRGLAGHGHDDVFADDAPQHRLDLSERDVQVDDLGLQHLAAAERQHLLGEVGGTHGGAGDLFGIGAPLVFRIERVQHDLGVADDRGQQVVEVVRDAAGQAADRFHLLRVAQLLFEQQPLRHRIVALAP